MNSKTLFSKIKQVSLLLLPLIFSLQSCISNKDYVYLQNKSIDIPGDTISKNTNSFSEYRLMPNDILFIKLVTEDEKMNALFNPIFSGTTTIQLIQQPGSTGTPFYIMGYALDKNGFLELPYLGKLNLLNKTIEDAKNILEIEAKKYFKNFYIQLKLAEFRFSILGSVNRPGQYFFMVNQLNILEALAMAGDVNEIAKRNQLILIREENGKSNTYEIDITSKKLLNSQFYHIHPNDIIYVRPVKSRSIGNLSNIQSTLNTVLPLFSTFLLVLNTYIILQNIK